MNKVVQPDNFVNFGHLGVMLLPQLTDTLKIGHLSPVIDNQCLLFASG